MPAKSKVPVTGARTVVCPGLPRFFAASVLSFPAALVKICVCSGGAIGGDVAKPAGPDDAVAQWSSVERRRRFHFHDVTGIEFQLLGDFQVTVAPGQRHLGWGLQNGAGFRRFAAGRYFK